MSISRVRLRSRELEGHRNYGILIRARNHLDTMLSILHLHIVFISFFYLNKRAIGRYLQRAFTTGIGKVDIGRKFLG